jgi:RNA polymerase sigma-70 factor (ECF subfamily)
MADHSSFNDLVARLRRGEQDAARQLFARFAHRLVGLARTRLDQRVKRKLDAEDVVQSVFKSFFLRFREGQFELENWQGLWGLLVVITLRKCGRKVKFFREQRRDERREVSPAADEEVTAGWAGIAREPTPEEAVVLAETVEHILSGLSEVERRIVELRLEGYTPAEISAQVRRSESTVRWALQRLRKRLRRLGDEGAEPV